MRDAVSFIESDREDYADALAGLLRKTIADKSVPACTPAACGRYVG